MDIATTNQSQHNHRTAQGAVASREPLRLDAGSWVAIAAFVVYIGVGILA